MFLILQYYLNFTNNFQKIPYFLDLTEVFLVWSILLATLLLNLVNTRQLGCTAVALEIMCLEIPHGNKIWKLIKKKSLISDVTTLIFLVPEITIYSSKLFSISSFKNILSPFLATVVTVGIFHEICLAALKTQFVFKHMNSIIQVSF
jgi:hypothetical protein